MCMLMASLNFKPSYEIFDGTNNGLAPFLEGPLPNNSCYRTGLGFGVFLGRSRNVDPGGMFVLELFRKVEPKEEALER